MSDNLKAISECFLGRKTTKKFFGSGNDTISIFEAVLEEKRFFMVFN